MLVTGIQQRRVSGAKDSLSSPATASLAAQTRGDWIPAQGRDDGGEVCVWIPGSSPRMTRGEVVPESDTRDVRRPCSSPSALRSASDLRYDTSTFDWGTLAQVSPSSFLCLSQESSSAASAAQKTLLKHPQLLLSPCSARRLGGSQLLAPWHQPVLRHPRA